MFTKLRKVTALMLAMLTLSASTTFSMGIHFCGDELESISVISAAEPCGMAKEVPPCHRQMATACCDDETIIHNGDEFSSHLTVSNDLESWPETLSPVLTYLYDLDISLVGFNQNLFNHLQPPIPSVDRHIAFHSILI